MTFDDREFRAALGSFATGVVVVTADVEGVRLGTTVSSFNSVSLSPPLVLFSLARSALSYTLWNKASHFGVTVLSDRQIDISNRFAKGGSDKWKDVTTRYGGSGVPLLDGGIATFECETYARHDGGDHDIIVGRVLSFETEKKAPLLFHGGRYNRIRSDYAVETPPDADVWLHGW